ncbi:lamin tail domain-containing protein [Salibacterium lacus]|uniref:Lamin tail domain-containing protein n=1 Tax=Salibacterium lacus TaxID=1898109 RepID=A0ABW5T4P6_9BACI
MKAGKQSRKVLSLMLILSMLLMNMSSAFPVKKAEAAEDEAPKETEETGNDATEEQVPEEDVNPDKKESPSGSEKESSEDSTEQDATDTESGTNESEEDKPKEDEPKEKEAVEEESDDGKESLQLQQETTDVPVDELPELLVTEIMPNNEGADDYEYFEVYNNSDKTVNLDYYSLIYRYTDDPSADKTIALSAAEIDPGETKVFWPNNSGETLDNFNSQYDVDLSEEEVVEYSGSNFYNGGERAVVIETTAGEETIQASYVENDIASGQSVMFSYPESGTAMSLHKQQAEASPGQVEEAQIPGERVSLSSNQEPSVSHEPLTNITAGEDLRVEAVVEDEDSDHVKTSLFYRTDAGKDYESVPMNETESTHYEAVIPGTDLRSGTLDYYITTADRYNRVQTDAVQVIIEQEENNSQDNPHVLITELAPNTAGAEEYEFFELYNNTQQPLDLQQYAFKYVYTDSGEERVFQVPRTTMEPQETLVFWYNNAGKELQDFNEKFNTDLTSDQLVEVTDTEGLPGFANGGDRALKLTDKDNVEVVYADYLGEDNNNDGKDIQYEYPVDGTKMIKQETLADPTPGKVDNTQVPDTAVDVSDLPEDTEAPVIDHTPVESADPFSSVEIQATVEDNMKMPSVTLYYKNEDTEEYEEVTMRPDAGDLSTFSAEIPGTAVDSNLTYYVEATDGTNTASLDESIMEVAAGEDPENVPPILVTEVVPDTTNVGGSDGYEFIEIYNNTNQPIDFSDYQIQYRYNNLPDRDTHWPSEPDDMEIRPQETMVFWMINGANNDKTIADFNENYGSEVPEDSMAKIYTPGMSNGGIRSLLVATNTDHELAIAHYNEESGDADDTLPDKGIVYKFPTDGSNVMDKVSAGEEDATPGAVEDFQVPENPVEVPDDTEAPVIDNRTKVTEVHPSENIDLAAGINDNTKVRTAELFYRTNDEEDYQSMPLQVDPDDGLYHGTIYAPELISNDTLEYYFKASDGTNQTESDPHTITIHNERDESALRFNVNDNAILSGTKVLKGTSEGSGPDDLSFFIDDQEWNGETFRTVEDTAYLAFEVSGINTYFQNAVTMDGEVIHIFDDWMAQWTTITVPVDPELLSTGDNTFTLRAGNKATPFEGNPGENRDDFDMRDVRLIMADGTILKDSTYHNPDEILDMGDDGTDRIAEDFTFTISGAQTHSKGFNWDTTQVTDGAHSVKVQDGTNELETSIRVDNTAPAISTNIERGKEYKGGFTIDPSITDSIAGVETSTVMLDEEIISLPYETSSGELAAGEHELTITAEDAAGNKTTENIPFSTADEHPTEPENVAPQMDETLDGDPILKVNVSDPMGDELNVGFYQGFHYNPGDAAHVKSFHHASETEPPQEAAPKNEESFSDENIAQTMEKDNKYMVTDSTTEFPYHRFEVTVDESIDTNDTVEVVWNGNSLEGRKVTMYAWNHTSSDWEEIDENIAGAEDFQLKGTVSVADFVKDQKVNVIVQDEIPSSGDYDYTFAWTSDTQYLAESYPHIFDQQTQWIADNKENMNIAYTFHTGDLVNQANKPQQWDRADEYMQTLDDADMPYGVLAGNHDVSQKTNDYTEYYKYFGEDRFEDKPYYGGSYKNNRGHYDLMSVDGNDYIMVYLGWGIEDEGIEWVNEVLEEHPNRKAILSFHEYLLATGSRHPEGEELYEKLVVPNENVFAVLSGHYHESQTLIDELDDDGDGETDRKVYQMLADYQAGPEGGQGYIRLLHFDTENNKMIVNTYSPYLDDYNYYDPEEYPEKDEVTVDLDLTAEEKRIATDHFEINVYSDNEIGVVENAASGSTAEMTWEGLEEGETYSWYAKATDQYSGERFSNIWTFEKGNEEDMEEPPSNEDDNDSGSSNGGSGGNDSSGNGSGGSSPSNEDSGDSEEDKPETGDLYEEERTTDEDGVEQISRRVNADELANLLQEQETTDTITFDMETAENVRGEVLLSNDVLDTVRDYNQDSVLEIKSTEGTIRVPVSELDSSQLELTEEEMESVEISVSVNTSEADETIKTNNLPAVTSVVDYQITARVNNNETEIAHFDQYMEREINSETDLDEKHAVVVKLNEDNNSFTSVPTVIEGNTATFQSQSLSKYTVLENEVSFTDIPDDYWAGDSFEKLGSRYIFQGREDGTVAPGENMRRSQLAVLITRALGLASSNEYEGTFTDVDKGDWFAGELQPAIEHGIIQGRADGTFAPNETVTRQQAASMLSRAMEVTGFEEEKLNTQKTIDSFNDKESIGTWAQDDVNRLLQAGVITGREEGSIFDPKSGATRAQMAEMLDEYLTFIEFSN